MTKKLKTSGLKDLCDDPSKNRKVQILLVGEQDCGKTALIMRYLNDMFVDSKLEHVESRLKDKTMDGKPIEMQLVEFKPSEFNEEQTVSDFRQANSLVFIFYAKDGVEMLRNWMGFVDRFVTDDKLWFIIQTKIDLGKVEIPMAERNTFCFKHSFNEYFEVSSATGENVKSTFDKIIQKTIDRFLKPEDPPVQSSKQKEEKGCIVV